MAGSPRHPLKTGHAALMNLQAAEATVKGLFHLQHEADPTFAHLLSSHLSEPPTKLTVEVAACFCGSALSGHPFFAVRLQDKSQLLIYYSSELRMCSTTASDGASAMLSVREMACMGGLESIVIVTTQGALYTCTLEAHATLVRDPSDGVKFERIACGAHHCIALTSAGAVHTWGRGSRGQLGHGDDADVAEPRPLAVKKKGDYGSRALKVVQVAAGDDHSMAVTNEGGLWVWGDGGDGRLGLAEAPGGLRISLDRRRLSPFEVPPPQPLSSGDDSADDWQIKSWQLPACGARHSGCITAVGRLYTWGCVSSNPADAVPCLVVCPLR